jgi:hypothetical protein
VLLLLYDMNVRYSHEYAKENKIHIYEDIKRKTFQYHTHTHTHESSNGIDNFATVYK